jgi:dipeptidyl aminopeptidase/acylaminoacyl peptidase
MHRQLPLIVTLNAGAALAAALLLMACGDETPSGPSDTKDNLAPTAAFDFSCSGLTCAFTDRSTHQDSASSIVSRAWDFGDGQTSNDHSPIHRFASAGEFTVTLTVVDDGGARGEAVKQVDVAPLLSPDRAGTYERETPHSAPGRHSRFVIRVDGRFELRVVNRPDSGVYAGRWEIATSAGGLPYDLGDVLLLDFDGFQENSSCGLDGIGYFLLDGYLAVAYCGAMIRAGFEEGVYTTTPGPHLQPPPAQGGQIAFVRDGRIFVANGDGSGAAPLSDGPQDSSPAWSPDGRRIAFARAGGIYIMNADGTNVVQRTSLGSAPAWSPDGASIAFVCRSENGHYHICVMKADDDSATPVNISRHGGVVSAPSWSPNGMHVAFGSDAAAYDFVSDIWVVAPDGSQQTNLRSGFSLGMALQHQPAWSPDGQRIAYVECPSWTWATCSSAVIAVMSADGSGSTRLPATSGFLLPALSFQGELVHPTWSPDGQLIAFGSPNGIEWVSADGRARGLIVANGHSPAWRP